MEKLHLEKIPAFLSVSLDEDFSKNMVKSCVFLLEELRHKPGISLLPYHNEANIFIKTVSTEFSKPECIFVQHDNN